MASYPSNIIQMPLQQPFNFMQNPMINAYMSAMMKQKFGDMEDANKEKKRQGKYDKALAFAKQQGKDIEYSYSENGPSFKTATEKEPTMSDVNMAYLGAASPKMYEKLGSRMGVKREALPPEETPGAMMSMAGGGMGDINESPIAPVQEDYKSAVIRGLQGNPALKANKNSLPSNFQDEINSVLTSADGDTNEIMNGLADLRVKHIDNPKAFSHISKMISEQVAQEKSNKKDEETLVGNPITSKAYKNIKGASDVQELLNNKSEYEKAGVDVNAILDRLGVPEESRSDHKNILQKAMSFFKG